MEKDLILTHNKIYHDIFPENLWRGRDTGVVDFGNHILGEIGFFQSGWFLYMIDVDAIMDTRISVIYKRFDGHRRLGVEFRDVMEEAVDEGIISIVKGDEKLFISFDNENGYMFSRRPDQPLYSMSSKVQIDALLRRGFPLPPGYENVQRAHNAWMKMV